MEKTPSLSDKPGDKDSSSMNANVTSLIVYLQQNFMYVCVNNFTFSVKKVSFVFCPLQWKLWSMDVYILYSDTEESL